MIGLPAGTRIWIAAGVTDLRRGFTGLSGMVQTALKENPFSGQVFVFRGRRGDLIKMLWWDDHIKARRHTFQDLRGLFCQLCWSRSMEIIFRCTDRQRFSSGKEWRTPSRPIERGLAPLRSCRTIHKPAQTSELVKPLIEALREHVMEGEKLHADDVPVPVLAPGLGKTKTGRLWTY